MTSGRLTTPPDGPTVKGSEHFLSSFRFSELSQPIWSPFHLVSIRSTKELYMPAPDTRSNPASLSAGTVFVQKSMILPEPLKIETSAYSPAWQVVTSDQRLLDAQIGAAGWNFFFTVGKLEGSAFGALTAANSRRAMRGILRQVQERHFNAVQITEITSRKMFGFIPYVGISAHARHIQRSEQLATNQERKRAQDQSAWAKLAQS